MGDERDRILKLLEDGKVTAEQAARLIEALGSRPVPPMPPVPPFMMGRSFRTRGHGSLKDLDRIPELVAHAVTTAVRSGFESDEVLSNDFPNEHKLFIKTVSGDVTVEGAEADNVNVKYSGGMVKVRALDDGVQVRSVSGDVEATMPKAGELEVETVSGDVSVDEVEGKLMFKSVSGDVNVETSRGEIHAYTVSGDVELAGFAGELEVESRSGDVELVAVGSVSGVLATKSGDITVALPDAVDFDIELSSEESGDIELELEEPFETLERRESYVHIRRGAGSDRLVCRTRSGDITVRDAEEE